MPGTSAARGRISAHSREDGTSRRRMTLLASESCPQRMPGATSVGHASRVPDRGWKIRAIRNRNSTVGEAFTMFGWTSTTSTTRLNESPRLPNRFNPRRRQTPCGRRVPASALDRQGGVAWWRVGLRAPRPHLPYGGCAGGSGRDPAGRYVGSAARGVGDSGPGPAGGGAEPPLRSSAGRAPADDEESRSIPGLPRGLR